MKNSRVLQALAVLLLVGALPLPYGYYGVLRLLATLGFAYLTYIAFQAKHWPAVVVALPLVGLFNPVAPVYFPKEGWAFIDVSAAAYLLAIAGHPEPSFKQFHRIALKPGEILVSLAIAAFAGVFAATVLAFMFFLLTYPLEWLGKPSPFRSLRYLFLPVACGAALFHVVGLAYHEASIPKPENAA